ncbi:hypothetical protein V6N13_032987 [Hibiscus sabdariffa]
MPFGRTGDYTIYQENYNMSRDLKSFLFHATDKNLAYVSPRFLLGSQSFVMDASERSKFIVNLEAGGSASMRSTRLKKQFAWLDLYDPAERECYWICMILQRRNALLLVDFSRWLFSFIELVGGSTSMRLTRWKKQFAWLDLYDPAEEECYWMAVDRHVSPTLQ